MAIINVQLEEDGPITQMDESELIKKIDVSDNEVETSMVIEYRLKSDPDNPRAVHRSSHVVLKKGLFSEGVAALLT